jgi:hypothetical protein
LLATGNAARVRGVGAAQAGSTARDRVGPWRAALAIVLAALVCAGLLAGALDRGEKNVNGPFHPALMHAGLLTLPATAQGPVSAALGADVPTYTVHRSAAGFGALNAGQRLRESFTSAGASVSAAATRVGLSLRSVGFGSSLVTVGKVSPYVLGDRVSYRHPGVSEWFVNGPLGLEQGFTVSRAPAAARGPLTLAVSISGDARPSLAPGGRSVLLTHTGSTTLRYGGLSAVDATGRSLHAWLGLEDGRLLIHLDAGRARYPLRIDPFIQQGSKLTGTGEIETGNLGWSVALSADGDTALVGAPTDAGAIGAAWVFTRSGTSWTQQAKLTGAGEVGAASFGEGVALSADGNTAAIGAPRGNNVGAVWVFTRSGGVWTQQGSKLTAKGEEGEGNLGYRVALSSDGNTLLAGAPGDSGEVGAAWVFTRSGGAWSQQSSLTGGGHVGVGFFGSAVALSSDGNTALIGGPGDNTATGAAWVFTRSGTTWAQQGEKLTGGGEETTEGFFGEGAALSADGNTALIGAARDNSLDGAAWVFTRTGSSWNQQGPKLTAGGEEVGEGLFGQSLALSADGNTALIGAPFDNGLVGAAWTFTRQASKWTRQSPKLTGGEGVGKTGFGGIGEAVALSSNAATALIGGPSDNTHIGAAWVFVDSPTVTTSAASEVTASAARVNATVNPDGEEVTACTFEYGATEAYGSTKACSALPGKGTTPVAVSASLGGLSPNTTYHFRVAAVNANGTSAGQDATFTTLSTSASAETSEPSKPAKATSGQLSVEGSGGTGAVTIGPYGSDIGGSALVRSSGTYFNVYHSEGASFTKIEYKDCNLGGAKTLWWDSPARGWEPIPSPTAVYTETPTPCITVTATASTTPSLAQLADPRHVGGPAASVDSGKCEATKGGNFTDEACQTVAEKKGMPDHKGKYEWFPSPVGCFAKKHGVFAEGSCGTRDEKKGKAKGKFEQATNSVSGSGGQAQLAIKSVGTVKCESGSSEEQLRSPLVGVAAISLEECELAATTCSSAGAPQGTIVTLPLEALVYEESGKSYTGLVGEPVMMSFTCGATQYTVTGEVSGETSGDTNLMSTSAHTSFEPGKGLQGLTTGDSKGSFETTLTWGYTTTSAEKLELNTHA